jgi:hypothetical protein
MMNLLSPRINAVNFRRRLRDALGFFFWSLIFFVSHSGRGPTPYILHGPFYILLLILVVCDQIKIFDAFSETPDQ